MTRAALDDIRDNIREYGRCPHVAKGACGDCLPLIIQAFQPRWKPIATAPRGQYILLAGDSGYITTPLRVAVGRWDPEYRPRTPWVCYDNSSFEDSGDPPTLWMELPT